MSRTVSLPDERIPVPDRRTRAGAATVVLAAVAFVGFGGLLGAAAAGLLALTWYVLGASYAFAVGQLGLVAAFPEVNLQVGVLEVLLFGVLLAPATEWDGRGPAPDEESDLDEGSGSGAERNLPDDLAVAVTSAFAFIGAAFWWASSQGLVGVLLASALLVGLLSLAGYGLHRYQLIALGLAGDTDE